MNLNPQNKSEVILNIYSELKKITDEKNIFVNEPLKKHTSMKVGGKADFLVVPKSKEEILSLLAFVKTNDIRYLIMGNGSNLLVCDEGIRGIVIKLAGGINELKINDDVMYVEAGTMMSRISSECIKNSLDGFSELSGIPGTFGGAVCMNAGAYGKEIKDILIDVTYIDEDGNIKTATCDELELSYRKSMFSGRNCIILYGHIKLEKGDSEEIVSKTREITRRRNEKQPLNFPSSGSTFKRPEGNFAAKLIEECGYKGFRVGGAMVSEKHSGFVINYDNATFNDIIELTEIIKKGVKEKTGTELELEVKVIR